MGRGDPGVWEIVDDESAFDRWRDQIDCPNA